VGRDCQKLIMQFERLSEVIELFQQKKQQVVVQEHGIQTKCTKLLPSLVVHKKILRANSSAEKPTLIYNKFLVHKT
jgi:hypothetical protein